jgi:hypothetical protein
MERFEKMSTPCMGEKQSCAHIEVRRNSLTPTTNIRWISPRSCTPYALGPIPFTTVQKAIATDCQSCKYFSGNQLLKCAVNPTRMVDDDCSEFERDSNFVGSDWDSSEDNPANYPDWKNSENNPANYQEY